MDLRSPVTRRFALLLAAALWALPTLFSMPARALAEEALPYRTTIEGVSDRKLLAEMKAVSDTFGMKDRPPASLSLLQRRMERDRERFLKLLKSHGFYAAQVAATVRAEETPVSVTFRVESGPAYTLRAIDISPEAGGAAVSLPAADLGLALGEPIRTGAILEAQKRVLGRLREQGHPFAEILERKIVVNHENQGATVQWRVRPGPTAGFGPIAFEGLRRVSEAFARSQIPWREGEPYRESRLAEARSRLAATGLFSRIRFVPAKALDEQGRLAVTVALTERKHRSVGGGLRYRTDEGPGANLLWEHRNFLRRGEKLSLTANASGYVAEAEAGFKKPAFLRDDQTLLLSLRLAEDSPEAYTSRNLKTSVLLERELSRELRVGAGLAFKGSRVDQLGQVDSFRLFSMPLKLEWDTSDDFLNPTRGGRLAVQFAPYYDFLGGDLAFLKGQLSLTRYQEIVPSLVLAGRAGLGTILGSGTFSLPADERFYAGGGGSVRGYAYQSAGTLVGNDPLGGRSLLELSFELRARVSENLGLAAFLDAGRAFDSGQPKLDNELLWATGAGVRWFTPVGPLRIDVAFPLDRRSGVDDALQLYVSIGQAF